MTLRDRLWCWWYNVCPIHLTYKQFGKSRYNCEQCLHDYHEKWNAKFADIKARNGGRHND